MMNEHFSKADIDKVKFLWFGKVLPLLGADMDANTARGMITHFIKPICMDAECAAVIVEHKAFYLEIMRRDGDMSAPFVKDMVEMDSYSTIKNELKRMLPKEKKEK